MFDRSIENANKSYKSREELIDYDMENFVSKKIYTDGTVILTLTSIDPNKDVEGNLVINVHGSIITKD